MSASSSKRQGWMDELKKTSSKKNVFENIEKDRFLSDMNSLERVEVEIPEIEDFDMDERMIETPPKSTFKKELNVDVLKSSGSSITLDEKVDLTILLEALEADDDLEMDEVWTWHQLFTQITAEIADEK